jgi:nucleotide-binding universal stress UspA family protein
VRGEGIGATASGGVGRYSVRQVDGQPVICAFQDAPPARRAVDAAAWLAHALRTPLEVIHVFDAGAQAAVPRHGDFADPLRRQELRVRIDERTRARMRSVLSSVVDRLSNDRVEAVVLEGLVVATLHEAAAERRAALLVSGTAARGGLQHVLEGSVTGTLAAGAPCPVVTVRADMAIGEPGPVLVGDDGSDHAHRARHHAAALADRLGRELIPIRAHGDDPVHELAAAGRAHRACLVATGTRGRGPLRAEVLGSVSSGLVQTAECPVMLVPAGAGEPASAGGPPDVGG